MFNNLRKLRLPGLVCTVVLMTGCDALKMKPPAGLATDHNAQPTTQAPLPETSIIRPSRSLETRTLQRLLAELARIDSLVSEAARHADPDARLRFDYQLLRSDMQLISSGIEAHVRAESQSPPSIEPIAGDYVR